MIVEGHTNLAGKKKGGGHRNRKTKEASWGENWGGKRGVNRTCPEDPTTSRKSVGRPGHFGSEDHDQGKKKLTIQMTLYAEAKKMKENWVADAPLRGKRSRSNS